MTSPYLHNLDPILVSIPTGLGFDIPIRWYGLSYLAGFYVAYLIIAKLCKRGRIQLPLSLAQDFVFTVALGTVIGGRLGYCVFYAPHLLIDFTAHAPFWGALALTKGGMASHGGMIGIVFACLLFARKHKLSALHLIDLTAYTAPIGVFFGRLANFINGELVGRAVESPLPWAVKFPQDMYQFSPIELTRLGPVIAANGGDTARWNALLSHGPYVDSGVYSTIDSLIVAVRQGNAAVCEALAPLLVARHPSQLYEALLEGALLFCVLAWFWRKPRIPGMVSAVCLTVYGVVRIIGEQFRMPDAHIGFQIFGTTRGQLLSILLIIAGATLYWWRSRSKDAVQG